MDIMDIKPNILSHIKININLFVSRRARAESIRHLHCKPHHTFVPSAWGVDYQHVSIKKQSCQYFYKQWIMKTIFTIIRISNSEMPKCLCYCASTHQKYACKYKFVFTQIQIMGTTYFPSVPMYVQVLALLEVSVNQNLCIWLINIWKMVSKVGKIQALKLPTWRDTCCIPFSESRIAKPHVHQSC